MRKSTVTAVAALVGLCLWAQDTKSPVEFSGRWEATFRDTVFLVLQIETEGGIAGTLRGGSISLNEDGDLIQAGPVASEPAAIRNAKADGATLSFDFQEPGDDEVMKFELKITGDGVGALRILDEHVPKMKGFAIKRTAR